MKITGHCIVQNEDKWVWFAIMSVLSHVDRLLIFDTGSSDHTVEMINQINNKKVIFEERGAVTRKELVRLRQEMVEKTETDWFLIVDGDEIWPQKSLIETIKIAERSPKNTVAIFNPVRNCIGDVFHYLPQTAGKYKIKRRVGNYNIRLIKKSPSMKVVGEYPLEFYTDENGPVQEQEKNLSYADFWYLHTSFLQRSSRVRNKVSGSFQRSKIWRRGIDMKKDNLPEVLFMQYPNPANDPLRNRGFIYEIASTILEPLIKLKGKIDGSVKN